MVNFTKLLCNLSSEYTLTNISESKIYVNECMGTKRCMLVSECSRIIEDFIFPRFSEWIIIAIYCVIFILGLVGNGLVCFVVVKETHMRSIVNIFILNLAVADFLVLLICLPPSVLADTTESWYLGDAMCKVVLFLQTLSVAVSILTLSAISIERYFAICHPLKKRLNSRNLTVFIGFIWIVAALIALPELLYQQLYNTYPDYVTPYLKYCRLSMPNEHQRNYQLLLMVILYDFPMCLMFFAYTTISHRLWKSTFSGPKEDRRSNSGNVYRCTTSRPENQVQTRRKAAKMLMTIVVLFAVCYLPVHVLNILMATCVSSFFKLLLLTPIFNCPPANRPVRHLVLPIDIAYLTVNVYRYSGNLDSWDGTAIVTYALISRGLCYFNSAINPVIYNFMSAKFRQEFRVALLPCGCCWRRADKAPIAMYTFRLNRSAMTRLDRLTMNTLTSRHNGMRTSVSINRKSAL